MCSLDLNEQNLDLVIKKQEKRRSIPKHSLSPHDVVADSESKKRKRDGNTLKDLLNNKFFLKPFPVGTKTKSWALQPLLLLNRSCLPLSFLDFPSTIKLLGSTRLFEANVEALELEEWSGCQPMVLVARDEESKALIALERESRGFYAVCQIGSWVSPQRLKDTAVASKRNLCRPMTSVDSSSLKYHPEKIGIKSTGQDKKRSAIEAIQSMVRKPSVLLENQQHPLNKDPESPLIGAPRLDPDPDFSTPISEIFANIRAQYFETLYLSRIPLTYFLKGPLSRARAAFRPDATFKLDPEDYNRFLNKIILPVSLFDKKYKDGIPDCIKLADVSNHSAENVDLTLKRKKKKKSTDFRIGKKGLYASEDNLVQKWWTVHHSEDDLNVGLTERTKNELMKTRISQLRVRETQMQIILILEALTLHPLPSSKEGECHQQRSSISNPSKTNMNFTSSNSLLDLIDIHIDRLCIWQSVESDPLESSSKILQNDSEIGHENFSREKLAENFLVDFCVEVIMPHFASRLPTQCSTIKTKLGIPTLTPSKLKVSKNTSTTVHSRPGAVTRRSLPGKPRPSLKRILTDDRRRRNLPQSHSKAIALMKSATMPLISTVKEDSKALKSVSNSRNDFADINLAGASKAKSISQRDFCITETKSMINSKVVKEACIEAEPKDAISVLKKPNRKLIAKEITGFAERRRASSIFPGTTQSSIEHKPSKGVQIFATPKFNRSKYIDDKQQSTFPTIEKTPPSFSIQTSPSFPQQCSSQKLDSYNTMDSVPFSVQATPSQARIIKVQRETFNNQAIDEDYLCSSPIATRRSSSQLFGSVSNCVGKISNKKIGSESISESPIKRKLENTKLVSPFSGF
ncbi:putative protein kinase-like [Golovinomyces cichoracearum]|uniref:DNA replication regulator Sld3 C-terminal domain-containing protein n=1 Tax=Golovinomyces cichoracearum TaxID=62708 RepID=A0A420IK17_9PEZI|nr:putative protein kinase-like [Golovinomyces cichoracearum]